MRYLGSFLLFLSVFFTLYGLLHYYFYWRCVHAFVLGTAGRFLLAAALLFLAAGPILARLSLHAETAAVPKISAYAAYTWMGALFLFFTAHLVLDAAGGLALLTSKIFFPGRSTPRPPAWMPFLTACTAAAVLSIIGAMEARRIGTETVRIWTDKLPPHLPELRVVQISDLHLSPINGETLALEVAHVVRGLQPDLLVSTGDLIDRGVREPERVARILREVPVRYGKFAVMGNHEFYTGLKDALDFTRSAGFTPLRNEWTSIDGVVTLVGVDDPAGRRYGWTAKPEEEELLEAVPPDRLTLLLKHQPRINEKSLGRFDLQISAHTHGGQIFPFALLTRLFYPYHRGLYPLAGGARLYVNRGTGTWGPPIRFLSPPEVTLFHFQREDG